MEISFKAAARISSLLLEELIQQRGAYNAPSKFTQRYIRKK